MSSSLKYLVYFRKLSSDKMQHPVIVLATSCSSREGMYSLFTDCLLFSFLCLLVPSQHGRVPPRRQANSVTWFSPADKRKNSNVWLESEIMCSKQVPVILICLILQSCGLEETWIKQQIMAAILAPCVTHFQISHCWRHKSGLDRFGTFQKVINLIFKA